MPFQSEKQRRYLWANEPEIARDWTDTYGSRVKKQLGGTLNIGYHGSPFYQDIMSGGFKGSRIPTWAGLGKTFTSPSSNVALRYGAPLEIAQSGKNFTLPFGGGFDKSGISLGGETPLDPKQATKGMRLMEKLRSGVYSGSPMAQRLLSTGTTSMPAATTGSNLLRSMFGHVPKLLSRVALPFELLRATPVNSEEANMTLEDFQNLNQSLERMAPNWSELDDAEAQASGMFQEEDESTKWFKEKTGERMIKNPNFPLRKENLQELYQTGKETLGGIWEYGKDKGIQGKDLLMAGLGKAINFPIGILSAISGPPDNPYQKFQKDMFKGYVDPSDPNKDPWGKNIRSFTDTYDVTDQWDKFSGSKLGQKYNLAELGADGLTEDEIQQLIDSGLKGYQLNRAIGLSKFNQRARSWKQRKDARIMKKETDARRIRKEQAAKEKAAAEQTAALRQQVRQQAAANRQAGTGGYQSSFGKDEGFMGGSGTSADMGSFAEGGLAGLWRR